MKPLKFKSSVKLNGRHMDPEVRVMLDAARNNAPELSGDGCVWCTSANDSKHMVGSRHFTNEAFDIRTKNVEGGDEAIRQWAKNIQIELGPDYDVINEGDHLHLELDKK